MMNLEEVKTVLYKVTSMFFQDAKVIWAEQDNTKPPLPYVTLKVSGVNKTRFPIVDKDDFNKRYYPSSTILEVNLYTNGRPTAKGNKVTGSYANTAVSDLSAFFNFIDSEYITDILSGEDIDISLMPPVRDLTGLENKNTSYRYRAMAEAEVSFAQEADNAYGIGSVTDIPNYSGGGTKKQAGTPIEPINKVVTKYIEGGT